MRNEGGRVSFDHSATYLAKSYLTDEFLSDADERIMASIRGQLIEEAVYQCRQRFDLPEPISIQATVERERFDDLEVTIGEDGEPDLSTTKGGKNFLVWVRCKWNNPMGVAS